MSDDSYTDYGKHFTILEHNGKNEIFISSEKLSDSQAFHTIDTAHFCPHDKVYESYDTVCMEPWQEAGFTLSGQDTSTILCSQNDDSIEYNRWVGEAV